MNWTNNHIWCICILLIRNISKNFTVHFGFVVWVWVGVGWYHLCMCIPYVGINFRGMTVERFLPACLNFAEYNYT